MSIFDYDWTRWGGDKKMGLIEKIEALIISDDKLEKAITPEVYDEWVSRNNAIIDVLELIKAELEPKDKPDSEGAWLEYNKDDDTWEFRSVNIDIIPYFFMMGYRSNCKKGKWIKAVVPEREC